MNTNQQLLEAFKFLNASNFNQKFTPLSQSHFSKKLHGKDSKGGFDSGEYKSLAIGFRGLIKLLETTAQYCDEQAEDKSLLINTELADDDSVFLL